MLSRLLASGAALTLCGGASAQHADFQLINDGSGQIKSGLIDRDQITEQNPCPVIDDNFRVYTARLDDGSIPHFENFPGFNACNGAFAQGSFVGFNLVDALRRWDGSDFDEIPVNETMFVSSGGGNPIFVETPASADQFVPGFDMTVIGSDGSMHNHVQYFLSAISGEPEAGVYLLTLQVESSQSDLAPTDPLFIVFADGAPQSELDAAAQFVQDELVDPACVGDLSGDGSIGFDDLNAFVAAFQSGDPAGDLDGNGRVGFEDLNIFTDAFQSGCP